MDAWTFFSTLLPPPARPAPPPITKALPTPPIPLYLFDPGYNMNCNFLIFEISDRLEPDGICHGNVPELSTRGGGEQESQMPLSLRSH